MAATSARKVSCRADADGHGLRVGHAVGCGSSQRAAASPVSGVEEHVEMGRGRRVMSAGARPPSGAVTFTEMPMSDRRAVTSSMSSRCRLTQAGGAEDVGGELGGLSCSAARWRAIWKKVSSAPSSPSSGREGSSSGITGIGRPRPRRARPGRPGGFGGAGGADDHRFGPEALVGLPGRRP